MFERSFQWSAKHGARLLFVAAAVTVLFGFWNTIDLVANCHAARALTYAGRLADCLGQVSAATFAPLAGSLWSAAFPFFGALVIQRVDLWLRAREAAVPVSPARAPSWLARQGPRLLLGLSVLYFAVTLVLLAAWLMQMQITLYMPWLGSLWSASVLLFAALALDRLDRWLATVRPYSG